MKHSAACALTFLFAAQNQARWRVRVPADLHTLTLHRTGARALLPSNCRALQRRPGMDFAISEAYSQTTPIVGGARRPQRVMSVAAKRRMAAAQRRRWAPFHGEAGTAKTEPKRKALSYSEGEPRGQPGEGASGQSCQTEEGGEGGLEEPRRIARNPFDPNVLSSETIYAALYIQPAVLLASSCGFPTSKPSLLSDKR
jgi:hypothetical protein